MTTELPFSNPERHQAAVETLLLAKQVLDNLGVSFWLSHGTLLGAIRDHDFIAHDSDIDLGIWDSETDHNIIYLAFIAYGFKEANKFGSEGYGHQYAFWSPQGVYIDLFFYQQFGNSSYATIWTPAGPRLQRFPAMPSFPSTIFIFGENFPIPGNAETWLEANYGPDWRTPILPVERGGTWHWADSPMNYEENKP